MPLVATRGAASAQGFGEFAQSAAPVYIEDVFSTYLYTGNGGSQTITNGIDLATYGGLWWGKGRSNPGNLGGHGLVDTVRGNGKLLQSNTTGAQFVNTGGAFVTSFNTNGVTIGNDNTFNRSSELTVSWTFRKQPKFFDVVTYTGTGSAQNIAHNLGSVPGCIIVKRTDSTSDWFVFHRKNGVANQAVSGFQLNATNAAVENAAAQQSATTFNTGWILNSSFASPNVSGATYVAYLFAHDAGGFGLTGTDNVISCGSYTGNGSATGPTVTLGYEPQYLMIKNASATGNWQILDNMRGMPVGSADATLQANLLDAESSVDYVSPTATGFQVVSTSTEVNTNASTYIYIAIRRGPMKTPTSGTSVFAPIAATMSTGTSRTVGFPADLLIASGRTADADLNRVVQDRLRGFLNTNSTSNAAILYTNSTAAEANSGVPPFAYNVWNTTALDGGYLSGFSAVEWFFRRAPGFFDEVCYTGTGVATTQTHNLGVAPELMIVKKRNATGLDWTVYSASLGASYLLYLNGTQAVVGPSTSVWNGTTPTASVFSLGTNSLVNYPTGTFVAYLFASCPGVSKVGSYSGTGATQTISCGFAARFVLIKRTDSTGDWFVWDTARGMVAGNDSRLALNSATAETNANWVYTNASGFQIVTTDASVNASGGTYIYLAIA